MRRRAAGGHTQRVALSVALLLLIAAPAQAQGQGRSRSPSFFAEVRVGYAGYAIDGAPSPVWVTLQNPTRAAIDLKLLVRCGSSRAQRQVALPPGARQRVCLAIWLRREPVLLQLVSDDEVLEQRLSAEVEFIDDARTLLCVDGRPRGRGAPSRVDDGTLPFVTINPRSAPTESICYRSFGAVLLREADPDAWTKAQRAALTEHVARGGTLIVTGVTSQRPKCVAFVEGFSVTPRPTRVFGRPAERRLLGLGQVLAFPGDLLGVAYTTTPKSAQLKQAMGALTKTWRAGNGFGRLFQGSGDTSLGHRPGVATKALLGVFSLAYLLAVGPILAISLRKSGRRRLAITTVALIGVFSALAAVVAGVVRTGSGRAYVREVLFVPSEGPALHLADVTVASGGATTYDLGLRGLDVAATRLPIGAIRAQEWTNGDWAWGQLDVDSSQTYRGREVDVELTMAPWDEQTLSTVAIVPGVRPLDATLRHGPKGYVVKVVNTTQAPLRSALLIEEGAPIEFSTPYQEIGDLAPGESKELLLKRGSAQAKIYDERWTWYRLLGVPLGWETWADVAPSHGAGGALRYRVVSRVEPSLSASGANLETVAYALRIDPVTVQGEVAQGALGITVEKGSRYGVGEQVRIGRVMSVGPAKAAGVTPGLIVNSIDDQQVTSLREFHNMISRHLPGERILLTCSDPQTGRSQRFRIKLVERSQLRD